MYVQFSLLFTDPTAELVTCKVCTGVHDHIESCAHEDVCPPTEVIPVNGKFHS